MLFVEQVAHDGRLGVADGAGESPGEERRVGRTGFGKELDGAADFGDGVCNAAGDNYGAGVELFGLGRRSWLG